MEKFRKLINRVDMQVLILVLVFTLISSVFNAQIYWKYTLDVLMETETQRAYALYEAVEAQLDPDTFLYINTPEDSESQLYKNALQTLLDLKQSSGVLYLYTAKLNENGDFVYIVDGLESHLDFRYPNDPIEEEILFKMEIALTGVESMPIKILHTDWGEIFMAYLPFHDENGDILGVVGIEFDASESYSTYQELQKSTLLMCGFLTISAGILTIFLFRRITNPLYLDKHTKDHFTGMRNRNAYEVDLNNLNARGNLEKVGVILADINGLKEVNDRLGHSAGDHYIELVAQCIHQTKPDSMVGYRTGGDEFVIFVQETTSDDLEKFTKIFTSRVKSQKKYHNMRCSVACGYTIFDPHQDASLSDTVKRADALMYEEKRQQKDRNER